jgi:ribokinase
MDFVVRVARLPAPGETALGSDFQMIPGGKGANQACAAGRLGPGVTTYMVGRVGYDLFADHLKASLSAAGVDVGFVHATKAAPTGVAFIWVDSAGQNSIVVASGANHVLSAAEVDAFPPVFEGARFVLFQLESPLPAVAAALRLAHASGAKTVLDPAPAQSLSAEVMADVDILTPNESEAALLLNEPGARITAESAPLIARRLLAMGARAIVLKLGDKGCFYADRDQQLHVPAFPVTAVDSTAAGDIFNAALAVGLTEGRELRDAMRFANASAALSTTRAGAQSSVPRRNEVDEFLKSCASYTTNLLFSKTGLISAI